MFTGIIDHCGIIKNIERDANTLSAWIECNFLDLEQGESISVDGICLTVVEQQPKLFRCDISSETCYLTIANRYTAGQVVNIERALRMSDRLGGHFVTGHIDHIATVAHQRAEGEFTEIRFEQIDKGLAKKFLIKKGCVAVNGVSLTINEVYPDGFSVMLIPHTLARSNLKDLKPRDSINIEFDWMVKIVAQQIEHINNIRS